MNTFPELGTLRNYLQLSPSLHTSGQPTVSQLARLAEQGIEAVINIALPTSDAAVAAEAVILTGQDIPYFHIPVDWQAPHQDDFILFSEILAALLVRKRHILVHCALNMRVSAFLYLFRVTREGISHEQACADLLRIWTPADQWYLFVNRIRRLHGLEETDFEPPEPKPAPAAQTAMQP